MKAGALKKWGKPTNDTTGVVLSNNMGNTVDSIDDTCNKSMDLDVASVYDSIYCADLHESHQPSADYLKEQILTVNHMNIYII